MVLVNFLRCHCRIGSCLSNDGCYIAGGIWAPLGMSKRKQVLPSFWILCILIFSSWSWKAKKATTFNVNLAMYTHPLIRDSLCILFLTHSVSATKIHHSMHLLHLSLSLWSDIGHTMYIVCCCKVSLYTATGFFYLRM